MTAECAVPDAQEMLQSHSISRASLDDSMPGKLPGAPSAAVQAGVSSSTVRSAARQNVKGTLPPKAARSAGLYPTVVPSSLESVEERGAASALDIASCDLHRTTDSAAADSAHLNNSNPGFSLTLQGGRSQLPASIHTHSEGSVTKHSTRMTTVSSGGVYDTAHTQFESARSADAPGAAPEDVVHVVDAPQSVQIPSAQDIDTDTLLPASTASDIPPPPSIDSEVAGPEQMHFARAPSISVAIKAEMQRKLTHAVIQNQGKATHSSLQPSSDGGSSLGGYGGYGRYPGLQLHSSGRAGGAMQPVSDSGSSTGGYITNDALELAQRVTVKPRSKHSTALVSATDVDAARSKDQEQFHQNETSQGTSKPVNMQRTDNEALHCDDRGVMSVDSLCQGTVAAAAKPSGVVNSTQSSRDTSDAHRKKIDDKEMNVAAAGAQITSVCPTVVIPEGQSVGGDQAIVSSSNAGQGMPNSCAPAQRRLSKDGSAVLASPASTVGDVQDTKGTVPGAEQMSLKAHSLSCAADTGSTHTHHTDANLEEKDSRSSETVELHEDGVEGGNRGSRRDSLSHKASNIPALESQATRCASIEYENVPEVLATDSKRGSVQDPVSHGLGDHTDHQADQELEPSRRRTAVQTLDVQGSDKGSNSVGSPQWDDSDSQNSAEFVTTTMDQHQESSSYLPNEHTRQLQDQYASAMESTQGHSLSYSQMKLIIKQQRLESESLVGPITDRTMSAGPSTLAQESSFARPGESGPTTGQWSTLAGGPLSHTTDMTVTPRDDREGQSQLPVTMTPALKALLRAVADGKTNKDADTAAFHSQKIALATDEDVFSPAASESQNPTETPNWAAPELVLKTHSSNNEDNVNTPMTPTHELFKSHPFSTRSEYSFSGFSGIFSSATEGNTQPPNGMARWGSVDTAGSSTPQSGTSTTLHTPGSGPEGASGGLGGLAGLRQQAMKVGRGGKKKGARGKRLARKSGTSMVGGMPLQGIEEEAEPPKCYTTHGNPFFQQGSGFSPTSGPFNSPLAPVRRMSFEPSAFAAGRTLASAVAGAAALGAFDRSTSANASGANGTGSGSGPSNPITNSNLNLNINGNSRGDSSNGNSSDALSQHHSNMQIDSAMHDLPQVRGNTASLLEASSASQHPKPKCGGNTGDGSFARRILGCAPCIGPKDSAESPRMQRTYACMNMHWSDRRRLVDKYASQTLPQKPTAKHSVKTKKLGGQTVHVPDALNKDDDEAPLLLSSAKPRALPESEPVLGKAQSQGGKRGLVQRIKGIFAAARSRFGRGKG